MKSYITAAKVDLFSVNTNGKGASNTVILRYIALHLSGLCCFAEFFTVLFFTVNPDWLRGFTVV